MSIIFRSPPAFSDTVLTKFRIDSVDVEVPEVEIPDSGRISGLFLKGSIVATLLFPVFIVDDVLETVVFVFCDCAAWPLIVLASFTGTMLLVVPTPPTNALLEVI